MVTCLLTPKHIHCGEALESSFGINNDLTPNNVACTLPTTGDIIKAFNELRPRL